MRIPRVYVDMPLASGRTVELPAQQSNYLCKVLRMDAGRELWLFNGQGGAFQAKIEQPHPKHARVAVGDKDGRDRQSPLSIELGIALSKGDRFDLVVQKATELGVTSIRPLITDRIEVRLNADRMNRKLEHWRGISVSACEQSGRNILPLIHAPISLGPWCESADQGCKLILEPAAGCSIKDLGRPAGHEVTVVIGPEGGFTEAELDCARQHNFRPISLGPRTLRTETAPLAIISILQSLWGDF